MLFLPAPRLILPRQFTFGSVPLYLASPTIVSKVVETAVSELALWVLRHEAVAGPPMLCALPTCRCSCCTTCRVLCGRSRPLAAQRRAPALHVCWNDHSVERHIFTHLENRFRNFACGNTRPLSPPTACGRLSHATSPAIIAYIVAV